MPRYLAVAEQLSTVACKSAAVEKLPCRCLATAVFSRCTILVSAIVLRYYLHKAVHPESIIYVDCSTLRLGSGPQVTPTVSAYAVHLESPCRPSETWPCSGIRSVGFTHGALSTCSAMASVFLVVLHLCDILFLLIGFHPFSVSLHLSF
jgi:hypothetical protein